MSTPSLLRLRYPAFAGVPDESIAYWLDDSRRFVSDSWGTDAEPAMLAYAAHNLVLSKAPGLSQDGAGLPVGVTKFRSASMDVQVSEAAANRSFDGGWGATIYGQEFAIMQARNTGGPRLVGHVEPRCDTYGYGW